MPRRKGQRYTFDRNDPNLPLITDTSPDDVPITFSNYGLRNNLIALHKLGTDTSQFISKALLQLEDKFTQPLRYRISNGENAFRTMTLPHPSSQLRVCQIYSDYSDLITYYCGRSSYSIRHPVKISSSFYRKNPLADLKKYRDSSITESDRDGMYKHPSAFFVYSGIDKYHKYFQSDEFYEMEKKFSSMLRVDVSKCFHSIYTHTISWSVKDIEFGKNNTRAVSFGNELDRAMQRMNYNETNGIPVGPEFSRIFAEIILQSVDEKVKSTLSRAGLSEGKDYVVRRYVDDYIIFASNKDSTDHVRIALSSHLSDMNLHLNDAKTEFMERPFQTRTSSIAAAALEVLDGFWQQNTVSVEREELTLSYAAPVKNYGLLAKSLIRSIKTVCYNNGSDYGSIASVLSAAIDLRIQRLVDSYDRKAVPKDHLPYQVRLMMALLEVSYFLYGIRPSVSASYKLGRSTVLAIRFVRANFQDMLPQFSEHIVRQCEGFLTSATYDWAEDHGVVPIEQINIMVCLTELPHEYMKSFIPVVRKILERTDDYFSLINVIYVAGRGGLLPSMAGLLESRVRAALGGELRPDRKAEDFLKLFDLISCPYLSHGIRQELVQLGRVALKMDPINRARRDAVVADFEANPWFTRWDRIDLLREITRRELNQAY